MQVLKFGGSSVANAENITRVIEIVKKALTKDKTVVVSSAISGCTDGLIAIGKAALAQDKDYTTQIEALLNRHIELIDKLIPSQESEEIKKECRELFKKLEEICKGVYLLKELSDLSLDHIVSFGELLSTKIISAKLKSLNISHKWKDSRELIKTEPLGGKNSVITDLTSRNIKEYFDSNNASLYILPGFIAMDLMGRTTTLGRGGSDYTASIIAVGAQARRLEIWTDVCGMMTADPRIVPDAQPIRNISYKEALELSHFGAKVVYPPTIQPVVKQGTPIYVKNTFAPEDPGTLIERNPPEGQSKIRGISSSNKIALLSMEGSGMVGIPGYSSRLFDTLSKNNINIILITQASSVHTMCIAIDEKDADLAKRASDELFAYEISLGKVDPLRVEKGFSIISLVGDDLKNQSGASGRMFDALGREGINIRAIAQGSSEKNVSAVVKTEDVTDSIKAIHNEFFSESHNKRVNIFIAGYGTVSKALVDIILKQGKTITERTGKELVICGIGNSKKFVIDRNGIGTDVAQRLEQGQENKDNGYLNALYQTKLGNSIFVDCTANKSIASSYTDLFRHKYSVAACNKIACSLSQEFYDQLLVSAKREGVAFKYETTVCAALPVLCTIEQLINAGDKIEGFEAIVSGTLNYLLSNYNGKESFCSLVKKAKELGYTEPDPRTDLSGSDVLRKFIISTRQTGLKIEMEEIDFTPLLPNELMNSDFSLEEFYTKLEDYEPQLKKMYTDAKSAGKKLRFIASYTAAQGAKKGVYKVALTAIEASHPFYAIEGSDNAFALKSLFYPNGIVIKGAGAGAAQTAGGVLNDILTI